MLAALPLCGAGAQQRMELTLDAGVANVAYDRFARSSAFVLAPAAVATGARGAVEARSALSLFEGGSRSVQLAAGGRLASPRRRGFSAEVVADGGVTAYNTVAAIGYGHAEVVGRYRHAGLWQVAVGPTVAAVTNRPGARALVGITASLAGGDRGAAYGCRVTPAQIGALGFADTELWGGWAGGRLELSGAAGARAGEVGIDRRVWLNGAATLWLGPRYGIIAAAGDYPADLVQGVPGGRFATLAVRLRLARPGAFLAPAAAALARAVTRAPLRPPPGTSDALDRAPVARDFAARPRRGGAYRLALRAPGAERVELMGDFTAWEPLPLRRGRGDRWEVDVPVAPGSHHFNVRVDGGTWTVPDGVVTVEDEFGSVVGVLSVF